uniref:Uncharacterized protein n=1 Tax=Anopheles maculatus TaxID=74869 RepID=A0A182S9Y7_9DIPT
MNANRVSQMIGFDNCTAGNDTSDQDERTVPHETCNQFTYAFLVAASGLDCFMSLVLLVAIGMRKSVLLRLYMLHLWFHMSFCFYCWLAVLLAFRGAVTSSTLLSVWGVVLILSSGMYTPFAIPG